MYPIILYHTPNAIKVQHFFKSLILYYNNDYFLKYFLFKNILKYFFYFLKFIFNINILKRSENTKK